MRSCTNDPRRTRQGLLLSRPDWRSRETVEWVCIAGGASAALLLLAEREGIDQSVVGAALCCEDGAVSGGVGHALSW